MRTDDFKEKAFGQFHVLQSELEIRICKTLIALNWIVKIKKILILFKLFVFCILVGGQIFKAPALPICKRGADPTASAL